MLRSRDLLIFVAAALTVAACGGGGSPTAGPTGTQNVTVGAILPQTGGAAGFGATVGQGIQQWITDANSRTQSTHLHWDLKQYDNQSTPEGATTAMRRAAADGVPVVMSGLTSPTLASLPIAAQSKIVVWNGVVSPVDSPWWFGTVVSSAQSMPAVATYAYQTLGAKKAGVLFQGDDYGGGAKSEFVKAWTKLGGAEPPAEQITPGDTNVSAQVSKVLASAPDAVEVSALGSTLGAVLTELARQGFKGYVLGDQDMDQPEATKIGGSALKTMKGVYFVTSVWDNANPVNDQAKAFINEIKSATGNPPVGNQADYYAALQIVAAAAEQLANANKAVKGDALRDQLTKLGKIDTIYGPTTRQSNHFVSSLGLRSITGGTTYVLVKKI